MVSPVIIKFKLFPQLGRLKLVPDEAQTNSPCKPCALYLYPCNVLDPHDGCSDLEYHYEPVDPKV